MALLEYKYVKLDKVLDLLPTMPLDANDQRNLRISIRRWARVLREAGHDVDEV